MKTIFRAEQFVPTQFDSAEQKAKFANQFVKFVESDYDLKCFPEWFYKRLSMTFGHIAHYNKMSFHNTFFDTLGGKLKFINYTINASCCGQPEFTYSDVEKVIVAWAKETGQLKKIEDKIEIETYNIKKYYVEAYLSQLTPEDRTEIFNKFSTVKE